MARTIYDLAEQDELPGGSLQYSHVHIPTNGVPLVRYFQEYLQLGTWLVEPRGRRYEICGGIGISRAGFPCALLCLGAAYLRLEPPGAGRPTSDAASAPPLLRPRCRVTPGALASLPSWRVARGVPAPTRAAGRLHLASTPARVHLISGQRDSRRTHHTLPNPPLRCSASQPPASCPPPRTPHPCYSLPPLPRLRAPPWPPLWRAPSCPSAAAPRPWPRRAPAPLLPPARRWQWWRAAAAAAAMPAPKPTRSTMSRKPSRCSRMTCATWRVKTADRTAPHRRPRPRSSPNDPGRRRRKGACPRWPTTRARRVCCRATRTRRRAKGRPVSRCCCWGRGGGRLLAAGGGHWCIWGWARGVATEGERASVAVYVRGSGSRRGVALPCLFFLGCFILVGRAATRRSAALHNPPEIVCVCCLTPWARCLLCLSVVVYPPQSPGHFLVPTSVTPPPVPSAIRQVGALSGASKRSPRRTTTRSAAPPGRRAVASGY